MKEFMSYVMTPEEYAEHKKAKEKLSAIFWDTMNVIKHSKRLSSAVRKSIDRSNVYLDGMYIDLSGKEPNRKGNVIVSGKRSFEDAIGMAERNPDLDIALHSFAAWGHAWGGVEGGAKAQEECLCRCSTLYPVIISKKLYRAFYEYHGDSWRPFHNDDLIYSPGIIVLKSDVEYPELPS